MAANFNIDSDTIVKENQPVCFGDKVKLFVTTKKRTEQFEEKGGSHSMTSSNNELVPLHKLLGDDSTDEHMIFQVLDVNAFEYSKNFLDLQSNPLSFLSDTPQLHEALKMETGVDDTGKDNENEEQTSGNRGPIYYEERVQLQHIATKMYVTFKRGQLGDDDQLKVCLREENGTDCIFKLSANNEGFSMLDEVLYGAHVKFETIDTANTVLTGVFINHDDTRISMETPQNTVQDPALSETMETSINNKPVKPDYDDTAHEKDKHVHVEETQSESASTNEVTGSAIKLKVLNGHITKHSPLPSTTSAPPPKTTVSKPNSETITTAEVQVKASTCAEQLQRHVSPKLKVKQPKKKHLKPLQPIPTLLQDLQEELSDDVWVYDFVGVVNQGHVALIKLIKDLVFNPVPIKRKNRKRYSVLKREPHYLDTALQCMKTLISNKEGLRAVLHYNSSCLYQQLGYCLYRRGYSTKTVVLQIMSLIMEADHGHFLVIRILDHFKVLAKQKNRFKVIVNALVQKDTEPSHQVAALHFLNAVVHKAESYNKKVFYQQQILNAGFSLQDIETTLQNEDGSRELKAWQEGFIDVQQCINKQEELQKMVAEANTEIEQLKEQLTQSEIQQKAIQDGNKALTLKNDTLHIEIHALQEKLKQTQRSLKYSLTSSRAHQLKTGNGLGIGTEDLLLLPPVEDASTQTTITKSSWQNDESVADSLDSSMVLTVPTPPIAPTPPPTPPPPPPLGVPPVPTAPPPPLLGNTTTPGKKPIIPKHPLPILNWDPIRNPDGTIFKELDYEAVLEKVDFTEFETLFQTQRRERFPSENGNKATAKQLNILEKNRTRNILIAKRRISYSAETIRGCIMDTDTEKLPSEHCELLLKCIPSHQELTDLDKHADQADGFGEAEQFMYQLAKIDGYESKLRCMAYIGNFDELLKATQPQINAVRTAAESVLSSKRLHQLFEIILTFGNYMNSCKKGIVFGFKLKSLSKTMDTKSLDRKQTLLQYIAHTVDLLYPEVLTFHEELKIDEACKVSTSIMQEDMITLREGLERCRQEGENKTIVSFCQQATEKVHELSTSYKEMTETFEKACIMFGERPKTTMNGKGTDYSEFFGMFTSFITFWKAAVQANRKAALGGRTDRYKDPSSPKRKNGNSMASVASEVASQATARANDFVYQTRKLDKLQDLSRTKNTKRGSGVVMNKQSDISKHVQKFNKPQQRSPFRKRK